MLNEKTADQKNAVSCGALSVLIALVVLAGAVLQYCTGGGEIALVQAALGLAGMLVLSYVRPDGLDRAAIWICAAVLGLGLLCMIASGSLHLARTLVICYPVLYALMLRSLHGSGKQGFLLAGLLALLLVFLAMLLPDLSTAAAILASNLVVLFIAVKSRWFGEEEPVSVGWYLALATALTVFSGALVLWYAHDILLWRITIAFCPEKDPMSAGYMGMVIRSALDGAAWWGQGTMAGHFTGLSYADTAPLAESELHLVTLLHQFGWGPFLLLTTGLLAVLTWGILEASGLRDTKDRLLAAAVLMTVGIRTVYNLMATLGVPLLHANCPLLTVSDQTVVELLLLGLLLSAVRGNASVSD